MWMPGNEWAPAWVSWRGSGDYYGWAPMEPRVTVDVALSSYNPPSNYWNFVPRQYIGNPGWHNYNVDASRNVTIISNTTVINNYSGTNRTRYAYAPGPDPNEVRRVSGNNFAQVQLRAANTPGERVSGSQYTVYQPRVNATVAARSDAAGRPSTPAPAHYETFNNMHPSSQYPNYGQSVNSSHQNTDTRSQTENRPVNQPANNQPAYNNHPATQNPGYNQPNNNNNKPVLQNPESAQPSGQNHQNNQPVNNIPANTGRPSTQAPVNNQPVHVNATDNTRPNNNRPGQPQTNMHQSHDNMASQTSNANHTQTTGRPSDNHNPNNGHPQQKPVTNPKPAPKKVAPEQKATENPKTKEAGSN